MPLEEIEMLLGKPSYLSQEDEIIYSTYLPNSDTRNRLYQILQNYDGVLSIDESYKVRKTKDDLWGIHCIIFDTDMSDFDLISAFPELHLQNPQNPSEYDIPDKVVLELENPIGFRSVTDEVYCGLKALQDSGISYTLGGVEATGLAGDDDLHISKTNVYTTLNVGDLNIDGIIDVSDAVMLARLVSEDSTLQIHALGLANSDVDDDGMLTVLDICKLLEQIAKIA